MQQLQLKELLAALNDNPGDYKLYNQIGIILNKVKMTKLKNNFAIDNMEIL
jgi:hypothetical protein